MIKTIPYPKLDANRVAPASFVAFSYVTSKGTLDPQRGKKSSAPIPSTATPIRPSTVIPTRWKPSEINFRLVMTCPTHAMSWPKPSASPASGRPTNRVREGAASYRKSYEQIPHSPLFLSDFPYETHPDVGGLCASPVPNPRSVVARHFSSQFFDRPTLYLRVESSRSRTQGRAGRFTGRDRVGCLFQEIC